MAFRRDLAATLLVNLLASNKRCLDGGEVDLLAVNLRLNPADELARKLNISGRVADLDQRLPFPIVRGFSVVAERVRKTDGEFPFVALGAQAEVNAKYRALGGRTGKALG